MPCIQWLALCIQSRLICLINVPSVYLRVSFFFQRSVWLLVFFNASNNYFSIQSSVEPFHLWLLLFAETPMGASEQSKSTIYHAADSIAGWANLDLYLDLAPSGARVFFIMLMPRSQNWSTRNRPPDLLKERCEVTWLLENRESHVQNMGRKIECPLGRISICKWSGISSRDPSAK